MEQQSATRPRIHARVHLDLEKIVAFLRVNARHVDFLVDEDLREALLERLQRFADEHPGRLTIELVDADGDQVMLWGTSGACLGAALGFAAGGLPGAAVGTAVGAAVGVAAAHVHVRMNVLPSGGVVVALR